MDLMNDIASGDADIVPGVNSDEYAMQAAMGHQMEGRNLIDNIREGLIQIEQTRDAAPGRAYPSEKRIHQTVGGASRQLHQYYDQQLLEQETPAERGARESREKSTFATNILVGASEGYNIGEMPPQIEYGSLSRGFHWSSVIGAVPGGLVGDHTIKHTLNCPDCGAINKRLLNGAVAGEMAGGGAGLGADKDWAGVGGWEAGGKPIGHAAGALAWNAAHNFMVGEKIWEAHCDSCGVNWNLPKEIVPQRVRDNIVELGRRLQEFARERGGGGPPTDPGIAMHALPGGGGGAGGGGI
jgi:hypothetical protein